MVLNRKPTKGKSLPCCIATRGCHLEDIIMTLNSRNMNKNHSKFFGA